jgi:DNA-binding MarR family transcriptional regulator
MNSVKGESALSTREHPHLGVLLARASRLMDESILSGLHAAGFDDLRDAHGAVFAFLPPAGTTLTELARRARITKQSMGELVRELEALGYLQRAPDPNDRRAKVIAFTDRGRQADRAGVRAVAMTERRWAQSCGADRIDILRTVLEDLTSVRR